jgi:hypothetical protein
MATWEKDTKNEGDRRIVLDPDTRSRLVRAPAALRAACPRPRHRARPRRVRVLSRSGWTGPFEARFGHTAVQQTRGPARDSNLDPQARTCNATDLLGAGVDIHKVAGRLATAAAVSQRCVTTRPGCQKLISAHSAPSRRACLHAHRWFELSPARRRWSHPGPMTSAGVTDQGASEFHSAGAGRDTPARIQRSGCWFRDRRHRLR